MMKRHLILLSILFIIIGITTLSITYALNTFTTEDTTQDYDLSYNFDISDNATWNISIDSSKTKAFKVRIFNPYSDSIKYGIAYKIVNFSNDDNLIIGILKSSNDVGVNLIEANSSKNISVGVTNNSDLSIQLSLIVITGYKNGGDLIVPEGYKLITDNFGNDVSVTLNVINGKIGNNKTSTIYIEKNSDAIFTITPNKNYGLTIDTQTCEGLLDSASGEFTIKNIVKDIVCDVTLKVGNLDTSGANSPDLVDGLIPVMYDGSKWVKADSSNSNETYKWYDYDNKLWANAVLVTSTNRSKYQSASAGTAITVSDILAYYVWIPRYKYKVWNINKVIGTDSYNAQTTGIDIVFENEKESTGTINCTYSYTAPSSSAGGPNETCTGSNGDYYTHPAFTFGSDNVRGFWIGKYEISSSNPATGSSHGGGNTANLTVRILPNVTSWRANTLNNFNTVIQNMQVSNNIYGLSTSRVNTDSHVITNYEWGAVAYLTNSKYGRCTNSSCSEVSINGYGERTNNTTKTGCGPISSGSTSYSTTCNAYNTSLGMTASTTGNITGVYDMSGGATEYVMSNTLNSSGNFNASNSGFASNWYIDTNKKYITTYVYGTTSNDQVSSNRTRLGDATGEVLLSSSSVGGWYSDYSVFSIGSSPWMHRGGSYFGSTKTGLFVYYNGEASSSQSNATSRTILLLTS